MTTQRGFTLIEMAIVMVILTFLITGLAMPLAAQIQARRIAETKKTLEEAQEAIIGYAMTHTISNKCTCAYDGSGDLSLFASSCSLPGPTWCPATGAPDQSSTETYIRPFLPCPDTDTTPDGQENRTGDTCTSAVGWFPWADLGTASQDAWGNRLHYSVESQEYADRSKGMPNLSNLSLYTPPYATLNLKRICRNSACTQVDGLYLPAVVFSHGPNGWGSRNVSGSTLSSPSSADELENTDGDADFVSRTPSKAGDASGEFDDLVIWISDSLLRSRVCPAGGCP